MKKNRLLRVVFVLPFLLFGDMFGNKAVSKTFLSITSPYQTGSPEYVSWWNRFNQVRDGRWLCFEITPFGGRSCKPDSITRYFLPFQRSNIIVAGDFAYDPDISNGGQDAGDRTVNAEQLNILYLDAATTPSVYNTFKSTVYFSPRETFLGLGLHAKLFFGECDNKSFWLDISSPLMHVNHDMNLCEDVAQTGSSLQATRVANVTQAFRQSDWNYGKICGSKSKSGFADVEVKIGRELMRCDCANLDGYLGVILPTGNHVRSKYVFEPVIGNNHHFGIMAGGFGNIALSNCHGLQLLYDAHLRYLMSNHQTRSFDLIDSSWSRYMEVYANRVAAQTAFDHTDNPAEGDKGTPGINYFTQCMSVKPGLAGNLTLWLQAEAGCGLIEFGYSCRARQEESVSLNGCWTGDAALVGYNGHGETSLARTIRYNYVGTPGQMDADSNINSDAYTPVPASSINCKSAEAPACINNTLFGSGGIVWDSSCVNGYAGIGGSWQFSSSNADVNRWMLWGKIELYY